VAEFAKIINFIPCHLPGQMPDFLIFVMYLPYWKTILPGKRLFYLKNIFRMKKSNSIVLFLLSSVIIMASCVPGKKFKTLQDTSNQYVNERDQFKSENIELSMANRELEAKIAALTKETSGMKQDYETVKGERDKIKEDYNRLQGKVTDMQNAQEDLIKGNVNETRRLLAELQAAQENLQKKENLLRELELNLDTKKASLDEMNYELEKRNARMAELEKILDSQKKIVQDLKNKVSEALLGFENKGLTVTMKDGKVYVSLDEKLLFKSASWEIDANGKSALKNIATVLEKNPSIQVTIEGHTDNVPYNPKDSQLRDNWDLSVKRATTVVRVLLEGTKIDPKRLTAAGRSQFLPVDNRNAADARQKNRRTEIILTPDLSELYMLINKY
jgi:chemotaxis protein MotB